MKSDERTFLLAVFAECDNGYMGTWGTERRYPRHLIMSDRFGNYKRLHFILEKWADRGWYEYGVSLDLGWLRPEGIEKAKALQAEKVGPLGV